MSSLVHSAWFSTQFTVAMAALPRVLISAPRLYVCWLITKANCCQVGSKCWQCGHQGAWKSTITNLCDSRKG